MSGRWSWSRMPGRRRAVVAAAAAVAVLVSAGAALALTRGHGAAATESVAQVAGTAGGTSSGATERTAPATTAGAATTAATPAPATATAAAMTTAAAGAASAPGATSVSRCELTGVSAPMKAVWRTPFVVTAHLRATSACEAEVEIGAGVTSWYDRADGYLAGVPLRAEDVVVEVPAGQGWQVVPVHTIRSSQQGGLQVVTTVAVRLSAAAERDVPVRVTALDAQWWGGSEGPLETEVVGVAHVVGGPDRLTRSTPVQLAHPAATLDAVGGRLETGEPRELRLTVEDPRSGAGAGTSCVVTLSWTVGSADQVNGPAPTLTGWSLQVRSGGAWRVVPVSAVVQDGHATYRSTRAVPLTLPYGGAGVLDWRIVPPQGGTPNSSVDAGFVVDDGAGRLLVANRSVHVYGAS